MSPALAGSDVSDKAAAAQSPAAAFSSGSIETPHDYAFAPDPVRAERLDLRVRQGLADSLRTAFASLQPEFPIDGERVAILLRAIEGGGVRPAVFGAYVDLIVALFDERLDEALVLVDELLAGPAAAPGGLRLATLHDSELGAGQSERYRRLVNEDTPFVIEPVFDEARKQAAAILDAALDLLRVGAPDTHAEIRGLVREIVVVDGRTGSDGLVIGGASTFSLWGALVLNANRLGDRLNAAVSLAHEAAHSLLFGLALGGRLVENPDEERYASPLRSDGRPMEGIAHATYVLARMAYALRALIASGQLGSGEMDDARAQLDHCRQAFAVGLRTVRAHARFSPAGRAIFEPAARYMGSA